MSDELPAGWVASNLGGLVRPSKEKREPGEAKGLRYIGLEHIESATNRVVGADDASRAKSTMVAFGPGDVLYSKLRPYLNKVALAPFAGVGSTEILVFEQVPYLDSRYLMHFLSRRETVQVANERANGVQLPRITFDKIADLDFPLPPIAEQRRIVAKVEELLAEVNRAKARLTKVQTILKRFRESVLTAACSGELTREWRKAHPDVRQVFEPRVLEKVARRGRRGANLSHEGALLIDDEMQDLPATWIYARADQVVEPGTVVTYGIVLPGPEVKGGVPYVRGQDVEDGWLRTDALRHTTKEIALKHPRSALRQGDVLLCIIRNLRVAIVPAGLDGANITQGMVRLRPDPAAVRREFLAAYLLSRWSYEKCWYTEARDVVSDYHVDHFRPKGRVKAHPDKPTNARDDGYWWLAFDWKNYRLAGAWANSPHKINDDNETLTIGKSDYFPLLNERFQATKPGDDHSAEQALLLDPASPSDASLLTFNETGRAKPAIRTGPTAERVKIATKILGLNAPRLVDERRRKWREVHAVLEALQRHADLPDDERSPHWQAEEKQRLMELMKLAAADSEFCATARACVRARAHHLADRLPPLDGRFLAEPDRWTRAAADDKGARGQGGSAATPQRGRKSKRRSRRAAPAT